MLAKVIESRFAARIAVLLLTAGVFVLAGLGLWSSVSSQRAADNVTARNVIGDRWGQVSLHVNIEDQTMRDFVRSVSDVGRAPLANAVGSADPDLLWLRTHGRPQDIEDANQVTATYADYTRNLQEMIKLGAAGDMENVQLQGLQAELSVASLGKQIQAVVDNKRLETTQLLGDAAQFNRKLRLASAVAFVIDLVLLALCAMVLLSHQRRVQRQADQHKSDALHDSLTGLGNRALLTERTAQAVREADRFDEKAGLLLIDLDRFKEVNDTLGHHIGDELLKQVADRLRSAVRDVDLVARLGGDEFAVLLPRVGSAGYACQIADRVHEALCGPAELEGITVEVSGSVGVAVYPVDASDADQLLQHADVAMYAAKRGRLGVVGYEPSLDDNDPRHLNAVSDLRSAIDNGEIVLYFQPKASARNGEVCGVEALARWEHPERGLLQPAEFIPVAEESGLIEPLTRLVLDAALSQCRRWLDAGLRVPVSVNVGVQCLHNIGFPDQVAEILERYDVDPQLLTLEITESAVVTNPARATAVMDRLDQIGTRLSIDDFGTGYSSISYLRSMRLHELKLDRDFVFKMRSDPGSRAIINALLELARNFGLNAVAEGVEDQETWAALDDLGCDVIQGYYLSRPMPATDTTEWLRNQANADARAA